jgi:hypothetical protein
MGSEERVPARAVHPRRLTAAMVANRVTQRMLPDARAAIGMMSLATLARIGADCTAVSDYGVLRRLQANVLVSVAAGLAAVWLGWRAVEVLTR